jgi:hypothetical protein
LGTQHKNTFHNKETQGDYMTQTAPWGIVPEGGAYAKDLKTQKSTTTHGLCVSALLHEVMGKKVYTRHSVLMVYFTPLV